MQDGLVGAGFVHALQQLRFPDAIDEQRTQDSRGGPGGQQASVNGADVVGTEHVSKVRGNGGEATAIHGKEDASYGDE